MRRVNGVWEKLGERGGRESEGQILRERFNYGVPGENRKVYKVFSRLSVENDIIKDQLGEAIEKFQLGRWSLSIHLRVSVSAGRFLRE